MQHRFSLVAFASGSFSVHLLVKLVLISLLHFTVQ